MRLLSAAELGEQDHASCVADVLANSGRVPAPVSSRCACLCPASTESVSWTHHRLSRHGTSGHHPYAAVQGPLLPFSSCLDAEAAQTYGVGRMATRTPVMVSLVAVAVYQVCLSYPLCCPHTQHSAGPAFAANMPVGGSTTLHERGALLYQS